MVTQRRLFSEQTLNGPETVVRVDPKESHHGRDVLRLREGDPVLVFDRAGNQFAATVEGNEGKRLVVMLGQAVPPAPETPVPVSLYLALAKSAAFESALERAVELGVSDVLPFLSERNVVKLESGVATNRRLERWRQIALTATKQCGRARLTEIYAPLAFSDALRRPPASQPCVCCAKDAGAPPLTTTLSAFDRAALDSLAVMIGPEGGLTPREVESAGQNGWEIASLGPRVLRVETAATAALTLVLSFLKEI